MPERVVLRQKAQLYRRLASIPTTGGHDEDRVLLAIADDLDHKAKMLDAIRGAATQPMQSSPRGGGAP